MAAKCTALKPERLELSPTDANAKRKFGHWKATLENYIAALGDDINKLHILTNFIDHDTFSVIEDETTYDNAMTKLKGYFQKPVNIIYARHLLRSRKQLPDETLDQYLQQLKALSKDCTFAQVTAAVHADEAIRDTYIAGLKSNYIRTRLLESADLDLNNAHETARALEIAQKNAETFSPSGPSYCASVDVTRDPYKKPPQAHPYPYRPPTDAQNPVTNPTAAATKFNRYNRGRTTPNSSRPPQSSSTSCYYCGYDYHPRFKCPARDSICGKCNRKGHYMKVCMSNSSVVNDKIAALTVNDPTHQQDEFFNSKDEYDGSFSWPPFMAVTKVCSASKDQSHPLYKSMTDVKVNDNIVDAVADTASFYSFIHPNYANKLNLVVSPSPNTKISMASSDFTSEIKGYCVVKLQIKDMIYKNVRLFVMQNLCAKLIIGLDLLSQHKSITMNYGGNLPPLTICGLSTLNIDPPALFQNLTPNCHPVATKRRSYSKEDNEFIRTEVDRLIKEGIIESSNSPWRAQIVVVRKNEKKRLAVDYSETINRFTLLDAYPIPRIKDQINQIALHEVYSTIDLRAAYHQITLREDEKAFTAFEANNRLYQYRRVPFGVTNGGSVFQRIMDQMVDKYSLQSTYPYMDNVTICGKNQEDHDRNLAKFMEAAKSLNLTLNEDKCVFNTRKLNILGCLVEKGKIRPDPNRFTPLDNMPAPNDMKSLKRLLGFFSYYSQWIPNFSQKVRPLNKTSSFPLSDEAIQAWKDIKDDIRNAVVCCIDEEQPFTVECDASDFAVAATLNQEGRPVAFFSRTLNPSECNLPAIEKEAMSIIEAVRTWRHLLAPRSFTLITDQRSVSFMFNAHSKNKIKNEKISRWRMELSTYNYKIKYRPGSLNESPDALSRISASITPQNLKEIHDNLCHPGVTRLLHFVKTRNLPYSVEEVREITRSCSICCQCKPQFFKPPATAHVVKATHAWERLNVDFKGPLPSNNSNKYFLTIVDEYSRFPFAIPCTDVSASSVCKCFVELFSLFGLPGFIHSDRGSAFMSQELRQFLSSKGIATSNTSSYNPRGNGQVERENSTIWKPVTLCLKSKNLPISHWQTVLPEVLHSIRSLLCTATNVTPHERLFSYSRKSTNGTSLPSWLLESKQVLLRKHVRHHKTDPLVEPVELVHANPTYAFIRHQDGREATVNLRDLAPAGSPNNDENNTTPNSPPLLLHQDEQPAAPEQAKAPEIVIVESTTDDLAKGQPEPIMGGHGKKWCNVSEENILSFPRRQPKS